IHVGDVARANILAMQADGSGECYNVGRGIGTSIKELTELLLRLTGSNLKIQYEEAGLTFVTNRIGCPKKAENDLDFKWAIDLDEGMNSLIDWRSHDIEALEAKRLAIGGLGNL
ncbi:unnamed protein product, partial [marine sediment metagenome]